MSGCWPLSRLTYVVDKDNHLRDALKYVLLSLPSPTEVPRNSERDQIISEAFETGTQATLAIRLAQLEERQMTQSKTVSYRPRWPLEE